MVFLYLTPMVVLPALALHFCVDHKRGMRAIGRLPPESGAESGVSPGRQESGPGVAGAGV